jgi:hypothetical protein
VIAGELESNDPEALAHLFLGALAEAGTLIGRSDDRVATQTRMSATLSQLIDGIIPHSS